MCSFWWYWCDSKSVHYSLRILLSKKQQKIKCKLFVVGFYLWVTCVVDILLQLHRFRYIISNSELSSLAFSRSQQCMHPEVIYGYNRKASCSSVSDYKFVVVCGLHGLTKSAISEIWYIYLQSVVACKGKQPQVYTVFIHFFLQYHLCTAHEASNLFSI